MKLYCVFLGFCLTFGLKNNLFFSFARACAAKHMQTQINRHASVSSVSPVPPHESSSNTRRTWDMFSDWSYRTPFLHPDSHCAAHTHTIIVISVFTSFYFDWVKLLMRSLWIVKVYVHVFCTYFGCPKIQLKKWVFGILFLYGSHECNAGLMLAQAEHILI